MASSTAGLGVLLLVDRTIHIVALLQRDAIVGHAEAIRTQSRKPSKAHTHKKRQPTKAHTQLNCHLEKLLEQQPPSRRATST